MDITTVRIDKWLWAVRLLKTRTLASNACRAGHVKVGGQNIKPARNVRLDEIISVRIGAITKTVRVTGLLEHRIGATLASQYYEDQTPKAEYEKLKGEKRQPLFASQKGYGRPTKKDRRAIGRVLDRPENLL